MTLIELPDEPVAALKAKAAEQGLTLEAWFEKLAEAEASHATRGSVMERMRELRGRVRPDPEGWTTRDYVNYGRR